MLNLNVSKSHSVNHQILLARYSPFITGGGNASFPVTLTFLSARKHKDVRVGRASSTTKALISNFRERITSKSTKAEGVITVQETVVGTLTDTFGIVDNVVGLVRGDIQIEVIAAELDPETGSEKPRIKAKARKKLLDLDITETEYEFDFNIPKDFGEIGAITIENGHTQEMFVKNILIERKSDDPVTISCNSWVHSKYDLKEPRLFFVDKSYLPSQTPSGLKLYREKELNGLQGDGTGERQKFERIYDYDVYNDLGNPDKSDDLARPVAGGSEHPYPRRCRTGRRKTKKDPLSERRAVKNYIPRDERFSELKDATFGINTIDSALNSLVPVIESIIEGDGSFPNFPAIEALYNEGIELPENSLSLINILPRVVKKVKDATKNVLRFEPPKIWDRNRFSWLSDEEFARQTLAGLNPCNIKLVTEWPLNSTLDPEVYGPAESAITKELVEEEIGGFTTVEKALEEKKLFILDYHDLSLPYVNKIRQLKETTFYGSRTLFFLTPFGTLRPIAIELTRPPVDGKPQWKQVFRPGPDGTSLWLWRLAKAHATAHDTSIHQVVNHWLRTHCCVEPYIIAANRQLSAMHPVYRLLQPHFRYTMEINALARVILINADGFVEKTFSPGKYSIEFSSAVYDQQWQFDLQALPADLINRGMAVEDPTAPHGLKLTIEDYPYANDGLLLWDAIKQWVTDYVTHYYPEPDLVKSDSELQSWWTEIRTVGHGDKKDEPGWPVLETPDDLIGIVTNMIWVTSGQHAAVNFGQYDFGGYFPNRPTTARTNMPTEDPNETEKQSFLEDPEKFLLDCFPSQRQTATFMTILNVLSNHSPEEEYLGEKIQPYWEEDKFISAAFTKFTEKLKEIEGIIDARNADENLRHRVGAGVVPYTLLKPFSESGVTGQGVPNSISI